MPDLLVLAAMLAGGIVLCAVAWWSGQRHPRTGREGRF
jgi:hypothetical protein